MRGRGRYELSTTGLDENLQLVGADPYGTAYGFGLRIPNFQLSAHKRWLYMLAMSRIAANERVTLVGMRQFVSIGALKSDDSGTRNYPFEQQVTSPWWHFPDGNVSWHLKRVAPGMNMQPNDANAPGQTYLYAMQSALLYEQPPTIISTDHYVPPNNGQPPGASLLPEYDGMKDIRSPWQVHIPIGLEIEGPCDIALFASVRQSDPITRAAGIAGALTTTGLAIEDAFVGNYPTAVYWRIAGALIFQECLSFTELRAPQTQGPARVEPKNAPYLEEPR